MADDTEKKKGPLQQVKPRWIAQNLAVLGTGAALGYGAGGAAMHQALKSRKVQDFARKHPVGFRRGTQALQGGLAVAGGFAANQARNVMAARLRQKRLEQEKKDAEQEKKASVLIASASRHVVYLAEGGE